MSTDNNTRAWFTIDELNAWAEKRLAAEAAAAPVQEPAPACWQGEDVCPNRQACCDAQHRLYTTPIAAQRQWVGLNDLELADLHAALMVKLQGCYETKDLYRAIEAKLKEKNK
jgi:hypothetical protein